MNVPASDRLLVALRLEQPVETQMQALYDVWP